MEQQPVDAAKALAFANGLRRNTAAAGRRWAQWPGGASHLSAVIACIDTVLARVTHGNGGAAEIAASFADLRAVLEWTTYQSASVATARAVLVARKTRSFAEKFRLLESDAPDLARLVESEDALIENVRTKNGYMTALADRFPQLDLPAPLIDVASLARVIPPPRSSTRSRA